MGKTDPKRTVKARGEDAPGPDPSPAWLALKARQGAPKQPRKATPRRILPGECRCGDRTLETGAWLNPWVYGHTHWCPMFVPKCEDCGMSSGTHKPDCVFWSKHPRITPF